MLVRLLLAVTLCITLSSSAWAGPAAKRMLMALQQPLPATSHFEGDLSGWTNLSDGATTVGYTSGANGTAQGLIVNVGTSGSYNAGLSKTITMPRAGTLVFWMQTNFGSDFFGIYIDDVQYVPTGQTTTWQQYSTPISKGVHTLKLINSGGQTGIPYYVAYDEIGFL